MSIQLIILLAEQQSPLLYCSPKFSVEVYWGGIGVAGPKKPTSEEGRFVNHVSILYHPPLHLGRTCTTPNSMDGSHYMQKKPMTCPHFDPRGHQQYPCC